MSIQQNMSYLSLLFIGIGIGVTATLMLRPIETVVETVVTEKIVTVEIEKPIITQQIVETVREVEVYRFIDEDQPVHKWVDPENQAVVYIYPEGYTGEVMPMYSFVPPVWFDQMLRIILEMNNGVMPSEVFKSIPKEWKEAVAPGTTQINTTNNLN